MTQTPTTDQSLSDEELADILKRLHRIDFDALSTRDAFAHARVMSALLTKITKRHTELVALKAEIEAKQLAVTRDRDAAQLETILNDLHNEMRAADGGELLVMKPQKKPKPPRPARWRRWLSLGVLP